MFHLRLVNHQFVETPTVSLWAVASSLIATVLLVGSCLGQSTDFDQDPILYSKTESRDPVALLVHQIESGESSLTWDDEYGWLPDLLQKLSVPTSSQLLVFSKTSLQIRDISPTNPRAIYFNDNVYIGVVPGAQQIEIAAVDRQLGAVFYSLTADKKNEQGQIPLLIRDNTNCLSCHGTSKTQNVPGFLIRSVFPDSKGLPRFELGTTTTDVSTDFINRFGGWYITGTHGKMRHRGNLFVSADATDFQHDNPKQLGANQDALPPRIKKAKYIAESSDIVAMMVLEHQAQMHNAITKASYTFRQAMAYQAIMNKALDRDKDYLSDSTKRRLASAADNVVSHLLFAGEFQLESPVWGTSSFAKDFQANRKADSQDRSLRDFDLAHRLFRYPCSYLIYSPSFDALPPAMLKLVYDGLTSVLSGEQKKRFEHLSVGDRKAILEILQQTKPGFQKAK
jgi:hypothetical protein